MAVIKIKNYNPERNDVPALPLGAFLVTPSDSNEFEKPVSVEVIAAGDLVVVPWVGDNAGAATAITIANAPVGYMPKYRVKQVLSTGTTATVVASF